MNADARRNRGTRQTSRTSLATRLGAVSLLTGALILTLPGTAGAHVTIAPDTVKGGSFAVVSFRVPTERDDASTTRVRVTLPKDEPIGSVRTTPVPGWKITVDTRALDDPIEMFGEEVDDVVSTVTWSATGNGIGPGQFEDFDVSMGPLPESGEMTFQALQTYSSGERVNWNQVAVDESVEPEHPAPVLQLTPPAAEDGATSVTAEDADEAAEGTEGTAAGASGSSAKEGDTDVTAAESADTTSTVAVVMSGAALLLSLAAMALAWKRRTT
jgi:uncharacterized protein